MPGLSISSTSIMPGSFWLTSAIAAAMSRSAGGPTPPPGALKAPKRKPPPPGENALCRRRASGSGELNGLVGTPDQVILHTRCHRDCDGLHFLVADDDGLTLRRHSGDYPSHCALLLCVRGCGSLSLPPASGPRTAAPGRRIDCGLLPY